MVQSALRFVLDHRGACGLGTRVGHPKIAWAKFEALVEGAKLASQRLWGC